MFSIGFTSLSVLLLFSLSITFFVFVHVFDSISSNIDEVLSINPSRSTDEVLLINFNVHHKDWLTYSGGTDRLVNSVIISNDLTQLVNFPTQIPDCDSHNPALLELFISSEIYKLLVFVL